MSRETKSRLRPACPPFKIDMVAWLKRLLRKIFPKRPPYEEAFSAATTVSQICTIVTRWISPRAETVDEWSSAEETWKRGYGDCEDFAVLVAAQCARIGIDADIYAFWAVGRPEGHAIVIGQDWLADMGEYLGGVTFQDALTLIAHKLFAKKEKLYWRKMKPEEMIKKCLKKQEGFGSIDNEW